jgi:DNA-binding Xre family transcriptional regulator
MNTTRQNPVPLALQRIRRISRWMVLACWALLITLPVALVAYWAMASEAMLAGHANLPAQAVTAPLALWQRVAGGMVMGVPLSLLLVGVWQARRCFTLFASGQVFTRQTTELLRRFAGWVAWAALAALLSGSACSVLLTLNNPPGQRHLMPIVVQLDLMLARRKVKSRDLAEFVGITEANMSLLKQGKVKGVRFETLEKICDYLQCQPGELLVYRPPPKPEPAAR